MNAYRITLAGIFLIAGLVYMINKFLGWVLGE